MSVVTPAHAAELARGAAQLGVQLTSVQQEPRRRPESAWSGWARAVTVAAW